MDNYKDKLIDKIRDLKGEREAARFGMESLKSDRKVRTYIRLQKREEELTKWIESYELDLELDEMKNCHHVFVRDFKRVNALPHFGSFEPMYYCVKCGLYGPCMGVKPTDPARVRRISDIYTNTKDNGFKCDVDVFDIEHAKAFYKRFKDMMPDVEDERLIVYLGQYTDNLRRGLEIPLEAYKTLDTVYGNYSPYFVTEYIEGHLSDIETKQMPKVMKK